MSSRNLQGAIFQQPSDSLSPRATASQYVGRQGSTKSSMDAELPVSPTIMGSPKLNMKSIELNTENIIDFATVTDDKNSKPQPVKPAVHFWEMSDSMQSIYNLLAEDSDMDVSTLSETTDSKSVIFDDQFGLEKVGTDDFTFAHLNNNRREAITRAVRCSLEQTQTELRNLQLKLDSRIQEIDLIVNREEKLISQFKTAFRKAAKNEMNEMLAAGWTRAGNLGTINLKEILSPFNKCIDQQPVVVIGGQPSRITDSNCGIIPLTHPPQLPQINPYSYCPCKPPSSVLNAQDTRYEQYINTVRTSVAGNTGNELDRNRINTFVRVLKAENNTDSSEVIDEASTGTDTEETVSSISTIDQNEISRVLRKIDYPCSLPFDSFICRLLGINKLTRSREEHKEKVRTQLENYFKSVKRYKKHAKNCLPGNLSLVCLTPPPSPKYPKNGLVTSSSSSCSAETLTSKDFLSDILSEFEESDPDEETFAFLFEKRDRDSYESNHRRKQEAVEYHPEVFTTTFQIGIHTRLPDIICDLKKEIIPENTKKNNEQKIKNKKNKMFDRCCISMYSESIRTESTESLVGCPAEVTEYWQLASFNSEPVWIYRGRSVVQI